jgi:hypothetical protein
MWICGAFQQHDLVLKKKKQHDLIVRTFELLSINAPMSVFVALSFSKFWYLVTNMLDDRILGSSTP